MRKAVLARRAGDEKSHTKQMLAMIGAKVETDYGTAKKPKK